MEYEEEKDEDDDEERERESRVGKQRIERERPNKREQICGEAAVRQSVAQSTKPTIRNVSRSIIYIYMYQRLTTASVTNAYFMRLSMNTMYFWFVCLALMLSTFFLLLSFVGVICFPVFP